MTAPDVIVVGAGVIGAACAYELAKAGLGVTVVERGEPGCEASGASAGLLSAFSASRCGPVGTLFRLSRDLYAPLAEGLRAECGVDVEHGRAGHIQLCRGEAEVRRARQLAAERPEGGEPLEFLSADDLRRLEPEIAPEAGGGLFMPRNEWLNSERLVTGLVHAAVGRGVRYVTGQAVTELLREGGRVAGVRLHAGGILAAGTVVLAAGAWSGRIPGVPATLTTRPVKGQILALGNTPPVVRHVLARDEIYLVPRLGGECLVGATVEDGVEDKGLTAAALSWLLGEAIRAVPALARAPVRRAWAGLRPAIADGLPAIGPWPDVRGLVVATGHFRSGILLAPVTARLVREWIVDGRATLPAADAFLPDRLVR